MVKPRDGEIEYKDEEELAWYYMFINACLSVEEYEKLKQAWEEKGGFKVCPWWKFIMENTKVSLDLK